MNENLGVDDVRLERLIPVDPLSPRVRDLKTHDISYLCDTKRVGIIVVIPFAPLNRALVARLRSL